MVVDICKSDEESVERESLRLATTSGRSRQRSSTEKLFASVASVAGVDAQAPHVFIRLFYRSSELPMSWRAMPGWQDFLVESFPKFHRPPRKKKIGTR
jgi:hypothetical protein